MNRNAPPQPTADPTSAPTKSSRRWALGALAALLLVGAGVGLKVLLGDNSDRPGEGGAGTGTDPTPLDQQPSCSDDDDPKELKPLRFGPPLDVRFERRFLDALDDRPLPKIEVYPWQPQGLVAVLGEHRMRGNLFAVSPDGKTLAVGSGYDPYLRFGDPETLHEKAVLTCPSGVSVLAWSPADDTLAVVGVDGHIRLFDVRDPATVPRPLILERPAQPITSLSFSADGKYLLGGDTIKTAWVWDVKSRKIFKQLGHRGPVMGVAFSPIRGDYRALTSGGKRDARVILWDALAGSKRAIDMVIKEDTTSSAGTVAFSSDGKRGLSSHSDGTVRLWDLARFEKGKELILKGHAGAALAAYSPDGRYVATALIPINPGGEGLWLWDTRQGKQVRRLATPGGVSSLRFLPGSDRLVFAGTNGYDANLHVHEVETGKELRPPVGHLNAVQAVAVAPAGQEVVSAAADQSGQVWDLDKAVQRHAVHAGLVSSVGFHPDGKRFYVCGGSWATLPFFDVTSGASRTPNYNAAHGGAIVSAAITRDGRYALTGGSSDDTVRMWSLQDGVEVRRFFFGRNAGPAYVTVAPDMRRALRTGGSKTRLFHLRCREVLHEWGPITAAPFLPDGRAVFLGGADAPLWKIAFKKVEAAGKYPLDLGGLSQSALSADGKRVAALLGSKVAAFELTTGKQLWAWTPPAHFYGVRGVALSADGGHLLTANGDGTVYVVRLP